MEGVCWNTVSVWMWQLFMRLGRVSPSLHCLYFVCRWMFTVEESRPTKQFVPWIGGESKYCWHRKPRDATDSLEKVSWNELKGRRVSTTLSRSKTYKGWKRLKRLKTTSTTAITQIFAGNGGQDPISPGRSTDWLPRWGPGPVVSARERRLLAFWGQMRWC